MKLVEKALSGAPGRTEGMIPVGRMASGTPIGIPFVAVHGARPGKTLWLNGQVHGDELNGAFAALQFANALNPSTMAGNVVVTPTANPQALDVRKKRNQHDDLDLDQSFPGSRNGLITERLAAALMHEVEGVADWLISLHTINPLFRAKPYAVYKVHPSAPVSEQELLRAISVFDPSVACHQDVGGKGELPGNIAGALDYQCLQRGIASFMLEFGNGSTYDADVGANAIAGFAALARHLGIVNDGTPVDYAEHVRRVTKRNWVTVDNGGFFIPSLESGAEVSSDALLGTVFDCYGNVDERIRLPRKSVVIAVRHDPVANSGDRAAFVATEWDCVPTRTPE